MRIICLITIFCLGCQLSPQTVKEVISGDTVILSNGKKVHYAGLLAPEKEDEKWHGHSQRANEYLVKNKSVFLTEESNLSTDETIEAFVYTPVMIGNETKYLFVNAEMARYGFCKVTEINAKAKNKQIWKSLWDLQEMEAKKAKRGIWAKELKGNEP